MRIQILIFIWCWCGSGFYLMRIRMRSQVTNMMLIRMRIRIHNTGLLFCCLQHTAQKNMETQSKDCDKKYLQMPAAMSLIVVFTWQAAGWLSDTSSWYPHCSYAQRLFFIFRCLQKNCVLVYRLCNVHEARRSENNYWLPFVLRLLLVN